MAGRYEAVLTAAEKLHVRLLRLLTGALTCTLWTMPVLGSLGIWDLMTHGPGLSGIFAAFAKYTICSGVYAKCVLHMVFLLLTRKDISDTINPVSVWRARKSHEKTDGRARRTEKNR